MKMLARVAEGWERGGGAAPQVLHLARPADFARAVAAFPAAGVVLLGMPLYIFAMPALVKAWIEAIEPVVPIAPAAPRPTLAFLVQSGFPEPAHSRPLERYLEKLARRLGCPYAGTIVRGSGEAHQARPDWTYWTLWPRLRALGAQLARDGRFAPAALRAVAGAEHYSAFTAAWLKLAFRLPFTQFYWNAQLKRNGAWALRDRAPWAGPRSDAAAG
jgi:hypothetical protein